MTRRILLSLSALLAFSACGDAGLTVHGLVRVTAPGPTVRSFDFSNDTRLDGSGPARFTGTCQLVRTLDGEGEPQWGAAIEIHSGGTASGDETPLTRVAIMHNSGAAPESGRVEVELGGATYTPVAGECQVEMPYALADGVVGVLGTCKVESAAGDTVDVELELDLAGCSVER